MSKDSAYHISVPQATMRSAPQGEAEVVSEAFFSEQVQVVDAAGDWLQIQTHCDGYRGWIAQGRRCLSKTAYPAAGSPSATVLRNAAHLYAVEDTIYGPILTLPFESRLQLVDPVPVEGRWLSVLLPDQRTAYIQRGDVSLSSQRLDRRAMCALSHQFLGLPYTWGGRSSFGYDCSGFVQMLYRQMGVALPRDARDQIRWKGWAAQADLKAGDLVFFGLDASRIQHVGLSLGGKQFIHATVAEQAPYLRISHLDEPYWKGEGKYRYISVCSLPEINPVCAPNGGQT